uniref:HMA domain-containing protein n=2 Tax=Corethron hystrix TaxID=216773 RepID=A0A7S1G0M0_9STRA
MKSGGCSDPSSKCCTSNERDKGATCVSNSPSLIDSKKETEAPINCFAFVQRNEVLICDRDNKVIRFVIDDAHMPSTSSSKRNIDNDRRLCFLTHGHDVADLLTPCFDSAGRHLKDEEENDLEPCAFCDEEDAHVHAHFYNEKYCFADNAESSNTKKAVVDPFFLASVVLRRAPIGIDDSNAEGYHILPSCGLLPQNQPCNSKEYKRLLDSTENGTPLCHEPCCHDYYFKPNSEGKEKKRGRKLYPVWHHDHIDYLVYHESSESVHLEYPCDSCGEMDIHGKFNFIGRRKWRTSSKSKEIQLNIFEIPSKPFSIVEAFSVLYETNSSRTNVCRRACCVAKKSSCSAQNGRPQINMTEKAATSGRSQFYVKGICCSSEVPAVEAIVNQLRGVHNLSINVTTRNVYVEHNLSTVTAAKIKSSLDKNGFAASIIKDAGVKNTQTKANNTSIVQSQLFVRGICCPAEIPSIDEIIKPLPGVKKVSVNVTTKIVYLEHDCSMISIQEIGKKLSLNNFEATVQKDGKCPVRKEMNSNIENTSNTELSVKIAITLSGVFWSISMLSYIPGWNNFKYFALCAVLLGLPPIALKAISTLRRKHFDANCLMFLAVVGALCLREFTEAAAVSFLYSISDILETLATRKARDALSEIVNLRPESANLIDPATDNVSVISADDVLPGQRLLVRPGEKIPCDGIILEGSSVVDESALTGESRPIKKSLNDDVSGGTINIGRSPLVVNATVTVDNSAVARLIQLVEKAQANRSPTERLVDKFAKLYTPIIVFSAFLMCTVPWSYGEEIGKIWFHIGLTTMIVACPCALIISTPVTYVAGLAALAKLGVIVKGGAHLEALGRVGIIALDKTGTLTEGKFKLLHLDLIRNDFNRKDVLKILTALEGPSIHPLANALIEAAKNEGIEPVVGNAKDHTILKGEGVSAYYNGSMVYVGNQRLFNRINMYSELNSSTKEKVDYWSNLGGTVGYIGVEGFGIIAAYCAADAVREEAKSVVSQLKGLGIEVSMLTGDSVCAAAAIGKQVGIADPNICAELLPHEKLNLVQAMKENKIESVSFLCNGKKQDFVLMCGDGINDTPALALANVGVVSVFKL